MRSVVSGAFSPGLSFLINTRPPNPPQLTSKTPLSQRSAFGPFSEIIATRTAQYICRCLTPASSATFAEPQTLEGGGNMNNILGALFALSLTLASAGPLSQSAAAATAAELNANGKAALDRLYAKS